MNRDGAGIGSASVVLMFTVLCLSVFALISYTAAENDKALADAEARQVRGYYEADTLAELIVADIMAADTLPTTLHGVDISAGWDDTLAARTAEFSCPVSDRKELYVKISVRGETYDTLSWRMRGIGEWQAGENLAVWSGD